MYIILFGITESIGLIIKLCHEKIGLIMGKIAKFEEIYQCELDDPDEMV